MYHFISFKTIEYDYKSLVKEMPHLILIHVCMCSLSYVQLFKTPRMVVHQALVSMIFSRQEYWNGVQFPIYTCKHICIFMCAYVCVCVCVYSRPPLSIISISTVLITHSQSRSKNIKWKIT